MELEFDSDELLKLYSDPAHHAPRVGAGLRKQYVKRVALIASATDERDIRNIKGNRLEKLKGDRAGQSSIRLNDQYRLIVVFEEVGSRRVARILEIVDYH